MHTRNGREPNTRVRARWRKGGAPALGLAVALSLAVANGALGQIQYTRGQNIAPDFYGWMPNPDGTFDLVFGYLNRNYEEHLHIPIGANNMVEPGAPDRGQPTYFLPRRNRDVFRITVPRDFDEQEVVWTLTAHGKTDRVYGSLNPDYALDDRVIYLNNTGRTMAGEAEGNQAPVVRVEGTTHTTAKIGEPLLLTAFASDDGIPSPRPTPWGSVGFQAAWGLRVAWFVHRGAGDTVSFDPEQFKVYPDFLVNSPWTPGWTVPPLPADGKFPVRVTFGAPGTFVLRVMAHDGGFARTQDVTVIVE